MNCGQFGLARWAINWWVYYSFGDVHCCCLMLMTTVHVIFRNILGYKNNTKNSTISWHLLRMPPRHNVGKIFLSLMMKGCISIHIGRVLPFWNLIFFNMVCEWCWLFGNDASITERWGTMGNSTFKWKHIKKSQFWFSSIHGNL